MLQTIVRVCQIAFLVLATITLGWFLSDKFGGPRQRELHPFERGLAERVVERVVERLPRRESIRRLLVMPVSGQELDGRITDLLVDRLGNREEYEVIDARRYDVVASPENVAAAIAQARRGKLLKDARPDGILWASVRRDIGRKGLGAMVELEARLVRLDAKAEFPSDAVIETEKIESRASIDWFAPYMEQSSRLLRLGIWLGVTGGLPFALFPLVQAVTRKENNRLNAILLSGLVAFDAVAALVLLGLRPGFFGWTLVLLAALAGFIYDFVMCDRIDEMRK